MFLDENFRPDVRLRPRLPHGRGFIRGWVFTVRGRNKNRVREGAGPRGPVIVRPRGRAVTGGRIFRV
jgi:hypothetical protein